MKPSRLLDGFAYACAIHAGQLRRGYPRIAHLLSVAGVALTYGADEDEAIAALLHDAAEDAGGRKRIEDIRSRFGERVAGIVDECTDSYEDPPPPWGKRKADYIGHLSAASRSGVFVSAADKLCNVEEIIRLHQEWGEAVWDRFAGGKEGRVWYYTGLREAFVAHGETPLIKAYTNRVDELERLAGDHRPQDAPAREH